MDYLKEIAGRMSAVAEEKLAIVDGGTYNEFMRLYSSRGSRRSMVLDKVGVEEQEQFSVLLEELQQIANAPSLVSCPEGSVLCGNTYEGQAGEAVERLSLALEKCLFFGGEGPAPDFWPILWSTACKREWGQGGSGHTREREEKSGSVDLGGEGSLNGTGGRQTIALSDTGGTAVLGEGLVQEVSRLNRVRTGYGRCRAWVRGLLGMEGVAAERELRRMVNAAMSKGPEEVSITEFSKAGLGVGERFVEGLGDVRERDVGEEARSGKEVSALPGAQVAGTAVDPVLAGASSTSLKGNGKVAKSPEVEFAGSFHVGQQEVPQTTSEVEPTTTPVDNWGQRIADEGSTLTVAQTSGSAAIAVSAVTGERPKQRQLLPPLWLRPEGGEGACVAVSRCLAGILSRLSERGLSIRPFLDNSSLDKENVSAIVTYTWPGFARERLRCAVQGAGAAEVNGDYVPEATQCFDDARAACGEMSGGRITEKEAEGLILVGPNGCIICRSQLSVQPAHCDSFSVNANGSAKQGVEDAAVLGVGASTRTVAANESRADTNRLEKLAWTGPLHVESRWLIIDTKGQQKEDGGIEQCGLKQRLRSRVVYFSNGRGELPPSRGWRAADAGYMPGPVLGFSVAKKKVNADVGVEQGRVGSALPHSVNAVAIESQSPSPAGDEHPRNFLRENSEASFYAPVEADSKGVESACCVCEELSRGTERAKVARRQSNPSWTQNGNMLMLGEGLTSLGEDDTVVAMAMALPSHAPPVSIHGVLVCPDHCRQERRRRRHRKRVSVITRFGMDGEDDGDQRMPNGRGFGEKSALKESVVGEGTTRYIGCDEVSQPKANIGMGASGPSTEASTSSHDKQSDLREGEISPGSEWVIHRDEGCEDDVGGKGVMEYDMEAAEARFKAGHWRLPPLGEQAACRLETAMLRLHRAEQVR
ncbi:unnamed protein product, partial [Choristocarpus tenellus]